ncbi:hypothetical protein WJX72_006655 [[Myrmecia] bisecta]|uniref:Ubiquitin-like modifier-activating enzyme ATG7 n=1 Tax=[Myrmecia] bisecta TaxID=41462 RepID=A0AAW1Q1B3_9CHLO
MDQRKTVLQFQPFQSAIDVAFWTELGHYKLDKLRLSEDAVPIHGHYSASCQTDVPSILQLERSSLEETQASPSSMGTCEVAGTLYNLNTLDRFKTLDRSAALQAEAERIWQTIVTGEAERHSRLLNRFLLLTFAELKLFKFYYWFAFPALKPAVPFTASPAQSLTAAYGPEAASQLAAACDSWRAPESGPQETSADPFWLLVRTASNGMEARPLTAWTQARAEGEVCLAMADPCNLAANPGWPLRNMLLLAAKRWRCQQLRVVCVRELRGKADPTVSIVLDVELPPLPEGWCEGDQSPPAAMGWEPNAKGKLGPRMADLGPTMDPRRLAESAVDLNLRLMRWRAAPSLGTDRLADVKCLLLGAGTLGCAVARTLLGWGVRNISFVDNSTVAFSNPVRQSLYEFEDCLGGGKPKATAAAEALQRIFPSVNAQGVSLSIPMPGHPISPVELEKVAADTARLEQLVAEHDVVFLLMDTRESRWLPTLLAAAGGKLAINAALGFDSFLVMRHGTSASVPDVEPHPTPGPATTTRLGCYFCNDVVAPLDSTVDRTLDQQCTVARPGLAGIAGALAVELMTATLQHPAGAAAPPPAADPLAGNVEALPLGAVPHMVRGQLGGFAQMCLTGQAFSQCTACSGTVVREYRARGWEFLLEALQDPKKLEDLTGLTELHSSAAAMCDDFDESDEDGEGGAAAGPDRDGQDEWMSL